MIRDRKMLRAKCVLTPRGAPCDGFERGQSSSGAVEGTCWLQSVGSGSSTRFSYTIKNLTPGPHGFHIHEQADFSRGCASAGPHYNPTKKSHGGPGTAEKHLGDLGNVHANAAGVASGWFEEQISLPDIIGRALIVHADEDDLGLGGHELSSTTGNAGARVSCGEIVALPSQSRL